MGNGCEIFISRFVSLPYKGHAINKSSPFEKSKIIVFSEIFIKINSTWFGISLLQKNLLISQKYLFSGYSKSWQVKHTSISWWKSASHVKFSEKCVGIQKNVWWFHRVETHRLSGKENSPSAAVILIAFWDVKISSDGSFLWTIFWNDHSSEDFA